jgi:glycerophosphoryl diester phosphodiesterase
VANLDWLIRPIAHRGLHDEAIGIIENTSSAVQAAIDAGYGIEVDVQEASDGEAMVFHDYDLDRLTKDTGSIISRSATQLKQVKFKETSDRMQTLPELLEQISGRVPLVIEIKGDWRTHGPFECHLAEILTAYEGEVAVMSFDPYAVQAFAHSAPDLPRGLTAGPFRNKHYWGHLSPWKRFYMRHLLSSFIANPDYVAYDINAIKSLAPRIWKRLLNKPLLAWTIRSYKDAQLAENYADAIIFEKIRPDQKVQITG